MLVPRPPEMVGQGRSCRALDLVLKRSFSRVDALPQSSLETARPSDRAKSTDIYAQAREASCCLCASVFTDITKAFAHTSPDASGLLGRCLDGCPPMR